jgi:competence protein ComEC
MLLFGLVRRGWAAIPALAMRVDPGRVAATVAAPAALAYTLATGGQTATVRALVVVLAVLGGVVVRRRLVVLDAVGLAAVVILLDRPSSLGDPSFQLSFVAALTLCLLPRRRADLVVRPRRLVRLARAIAGALRVSIAVTATTAPITAWHFHQVALGGVVGNLVLGPVVELFVIPVGLAGLLLDALGGPGGTLLDAAIVAAGVVDRGARLLGAVIPLVEVPPPRAIEILAWYAALAGGWQWRRRGAPALFAIAATVGLASVAWSCVERRTRDTVEITFVDVGQGDAAVIELPGGAVWLIDAGGNPADPAPTRHGPGDALLRFLRARRIDHVDVAILSHPHPDHYLGFLALAGRISIGELWIARPAGPAPTAPTDYAGFAEVAATLERAGTRVIAPPLGTARTDHGVRLEVLGPTYDDGDGPLPVAAADPVRSVNDDSLVVALAFAGRRVLFLGDVEREGEDALVAGGVAFADVVKVAHHGSPTSSSAELVAAAHARLAVISCGRANRFGFPAADVMTRWAASGATVYRTDRDGAITIEIAPSGQIRVKTYD